MTRMNTQKIARICTITLSGVLAVGLAAATAAPAFGQAHGTFTFTGSMHQSRQRHTATLLANGQVLVAGGINVFGNSLSSAELYNPSTGMWTVTGSMSTPRNNHTATLLSNGQVLVTGGENVHISGNREVGVILDSAELYNPSTGKWTTTGSMTVARAWHGAALLQDGEVLVAGGYSLSSPGSISGSSPAAAAELYDPSTGTFTATGSMNYPRVNSQLTPLQNGEALIAGGGDGDASCTAELFSNGRWRLTSNLFFCGYNGGETAALLPNGDVVITGPSGASQFYDPSTNVWQATNGQQSADSVQGPLALLATGKVLLAGTEFSQGSSAALYDPSTNEWTPTGNLNVARGGHTLTRLLNGQVLAAGGRALLYDGPQAISSAELYTP
jgi:hypothetical protein